MKREKIDDRSYVEVEGDSMNLTISKFSYGVIVFFATGLFFTGSIFFLDKEDSVINYRIYWVIGFILFSSLLYNVLFQQKITWEYSAHKTKSSKSIWFIPIGNNVVSYSSDSVFLYENIFDSYNKRVTRIWLVARSAKDKKQVRLFCFEDSYSFLKFQKYYNEWRPDNKILEWHE